MKVGDLVRYRYSWGEPSTAFIVAEVMYLEGPHNPSNGLVKLFGVNDGIDNDWLTMVGVEVISESR